MATFDPCQHGTIGYCQVCLPRFTPQPCACKDEIAQLRDEIRELREQLATAVKIRFVDE